jgi:hypothetical protein
MAKTYNKKRNTYFLFEALVNGFASKQISSPGTGEEEFVALSRRFFEPESQLKIERELYETVLNLRGSGLIHEEILHVLRECKARRGKVHGKTLFEEQTSVLNGLYESFGEDALSFEVDSYKLLANTKQYFDSDDLIESVRFERLLCEEIESEPESEILSEPPVGEAVPVESDEQKTLVGLYEAKNPGFALFLHDEIRRIRPILREASICPECTSCDLEMKGKVVQVLHMLEDFKTRPVERSDVKFFVKVQALAKELEEA